MSLSEFPYEPFTCEKSLFFESLDKSTGKFKRWIECVEYYIDENGIEQTRETGKVCVKNPADWWIEYLNSKDRT